MKVTEVRRLKDLEKESTRLKNALADLTQDKLILKEPSGETFGPGRKQCCVEHVREKLDVSERRAVR
jgi:hypothetical protein